jgi:hypothetical protein
MEVSGQRHAPAALLMGKGPQCPLSRRLVGLRADRDPLEKIKFSYSSRESSRILRFPIRSRAAIRATIPRLFTYTHFLACLKCFCDEPSLRMFS